MSLDKNPTPLPEVIRKEVAAIVAKGKEEETEWNQLFWWFDGKNFSSSSKDLLKRYGKCGTSCCVAGHAIAVADRLGVKLERDGIERAAQEVLNLTEREAEWLFSFARTQSQIVNALETGVFGNEST